MADLDATIYDKLKKARQSKGLALKPTPRFNTTLALDNGETVPIKLRPYQAIGVYHLLLQRRMILGDDCGLGKTCQMLAALCHQWDGPQEGTNKVIVVAPKSALRQWASEAKKFTSDVEPIVASGTQKKRQKAYEEFFKADPKNGTKTILILGYQTLARDWTYGEEITKVGRTTKVKPGLLAGYIKAEGHTPWVVVFDEITACKNPSTRTHQVCAQLSKECSRAYGLTATLLKNSLLEGFGIYKVLRPDLFTSKTAFISDYCVTKLQYAKGGRQIPVIVGYKNLEGFRRVIDPYYLGRHKHDVSDDLPTLLTREVPCELSEAEDRKYEEALSGVLELGDGDVREYEETKALTSLVYCQLTVDSLSLLGYAEGQTLGGDTPLPEGGEIPSPLATAAMGAKEETLLDMLSEELEGEKVIVYTRFESLVERLMALCAQAKIPAVRITGAESDKKRDQAKTAFQTDPKIKVVFITDAASEAINLQAAKAMVFYDSPWSWGHYVQLLGRMIRIGSPHKGVLAYHLIAERPAKGKADRKTIDTHVVEVLRRKKGMIDKVLGEGAVGALDFKAGEGTKDLLRLMQGKP